MKVFQKAKISTKGRRLKVGLVLLALVAGLTAAEMLFRLNLPEPENLAKLKSSPVFLYENRPNTTFIYRASEFANEIKINSDGFRDDEFSREKSKDVLRIAVLGDSQEEALQVSLGDTWQKVMAKKLSEALGRKVEAYNFGVSGYGTDQEWLTLRKKVWQFSPDMVILAFSPNDVGDTYKNNLVRIKNGQLEIVSVKERAGGNFLGKLVRETYTYHLIVKVASGNTLTKAVVEKFRTKILGFPKNEKFLLSDAQLTQGPFEVIASQKNPPPEVLEAWVTVKDLMADMKKQNDQHQVQFLVTLNIPRAQVDPQGWESLRDLYGLDPEFSSSFQINEVIGQIAQELRIAFYDPRLAAVDWQEKTGDLYWPVDAHFNQNGHLFMGTKVAEFILDNYLLNRL